MEMTSLRQIFVPVDRGFEARSFFRILLVFAALVAFASLLSDGVFLQPGNLANLGFQNAILAVVTLGQLLIILTGGIDLSIGAVLAISSVTVVLFQDYGLAVSFGLALGVALLFGLLNGGLVTFVRLPSFVVTLAVMQIAYSLAKVLSKGGAVYSGLQGAEIAPALANFYQGRLLGVPLPILFVGLVMVVIAFFLRTSIGHFIYAVGGNKRAAYLSGIPVRLVSMSAYAVAAMLAAVGGILFVSRVGMGDPQAGQWLALDSIAAVSIGGASLAGGIGTVPGTLVGVLILSVLDNIMNLLGVPPTVQPAVKGLVILIAVYLNSHQKKQ